ncbi:MAG: choice-of-anchor D domain-containing protein, partial [Chloroflexia bacterium]|nr:choice-of-anchor D domain-containing protein [Chloroflexia bacterium]
YINELLISSNDPVNPEVTFTTKLDVIGHPEINVSPASIEFSSIFQTLSETRMLSIENTGSKDLSVSSISSDNASFTVDFAGSIMVAPTQTVDVEVTYTAINIGEVTGNITIESDDEFGNQTVIVPVSGTGLVPPEMVVTTDPDPVDITMNSGASDTIKVMVQNAGGSPLSYVMVKPYYTNIGDVTITEGTAPELTSKEQLDNRTGSVVQHGNGGPDAFGYTWVDNDAGTEVVYDWIEISDVGTKLDLGGDNGIYVTLPLTSHSTTKPIIRYRLPPTDSLLLGII